MKKIIYIVSFLYFVFPICTKAQKAEFISKGKIEFEKRVNVFAIMKELTKDDANSSWMESYQDMVKKNMSQFQTSCFDLYFDKDKTVYQGGKENPDNQKNTFWSMDRNEGDNITYSDYASQQTTRLKHIFEDYFLVKDSCRQINWKMTTETRAIAGITCRRANAVILDSIYVVAFYTDQILSPGGPESFGGLPGMILGVALPYDHVTWFATRVTEMPDVDKKIVEPLKGKKVTYKELIANLQPVMKNWGTEGKMMLKNTVL